MPACKSFASVQTITIILLNILQRWDARLCSSSLKNVRLTVANIACRKDRVAKEDRDNNKASNDWFQSLSLPSFGSHHVMKELSL